MAWDTASAKTVKLYTSQILPEYFPNISLIIFFSFLEKFMVAVVVSKTKKKVTVAFSFLLDLHIFAGAMTVLQNLILPLKFFLSDTLPSSLKKMSTPLD